MTPAMIDMGKYAAFVWPAYAVSVVGFAWMIVDTAMRARRARRAVERLEADRRARDALP